MNFRFSNLALWVTTLVLAFVAGYLAGVSWRGVEKNTHAVARPVDGIHVIGERARDHVGAANTRSGIDGVLPASEARAKAFEALRESDRVERMRKLCEVLDKVSPENWREVFEGFRRQAAAEGRIGAAEWELMLRQIGRVAGAEAIEHLHADKTGAPKRVLTALSGWAESDPNAASAWKNEHSNQFDKTEMAEAFYRGAADGNAEVALQLALQHGNSTKIYDIIIDGAIQRGGLKAADDLVNAVLSGKSPAQMPDRFGEYKNRQMASLFAALARREIEAAQEVNDPARVLGWLDQHLSKSYMDDETVSRVTEAASHANAGLTIEWLNDRESQMPQRQAWWSYREVAKAWRIQEPEQFTAWVQAHPDHPQLPIIVQGAWDSAIEWQQSSAARKWADGIGNPQVSSWVESWISAAEARKQSGADVK